MKQSIYRLLGRGVYPIGAYCAPQCACESDGVKYPDRITQHQYDLLVAAGVNLFYGHSEVSGSATQAGVKKALDCAFRAGAGYLAKIEEAEEYCSVGYSWQGYPDYRALSKLEKEKLDDRFARALEKYAAHPAFFGISFRDEPGREMFDGIAAGKKIFEKVCGDKFFYVNMFPYYITPEQYQYGVPNAPKCDRKEYFTDKPNGKRYEAFVDDYLSTVNPEVFSYDAYPFVTLGAGAETGVHEVLYDIPQYLACKERENGLPFWMFMQEGGKWENDMNVRIPASGEHRLQFNVGLAFGAKGLQLFPCCYPNDWLGDRVARAGLIDAMGNPTELYGYVARETKQVKAVGAYILDSEWKGLIVSGEFNGLLASESVLKKIKWNECIFRGKLPSGEKYSKDSFGDIESISATSQVIAGCFEKNGKEFCYMVNNSPTTAARLAVRFASPVSGFTVRGGAKENFAAKELKIAALSAGEGILVMPEKKEEV